jgi:hypothetical protein
MNLRAWHSRRRPLAGPHSGLCRRLARILGAALLLMVCSLQSGAQETVYDADQVKAAFLYHFGTYVQWPTAAEGEPITIAILDEPRIVAELAAFVPGRTVQGRPVQVVSIAAIEDAADAEILFIGRAHNERLAPTIARLEERPTLVVTDASDGLDQGAMINFVLVDSRVRFEISVPRSIRAGLMLSSRLLSAAQRVVTP